MTEYTDALKTRLAVFGPVVVRRMFGAHGVFYQGLMFGLVDDDQLYLKADAISVATYENCDLRQFQYLREGRWVGLSYYSAPPDMFDSEESALRWATIAYESALRAQAKKPRRRARQGLANGNPVLRY